MIHKNIHGSVEWEVQPDRVSLREDEFHHLHVTVDDEEFHDVRPKYAFPLSEKADYISFLNSDDEEVLLLVHPGKLEKKSRRTLEKALRRTYYTPRILEVFEITEAMGVSRWVVRTDRGHAVFEVSSRKSDIRLMADGGCLISDADGNRFMIENQADLDPRSQALIAHET